MRQTLIAFILIAILLAGGFAWQRLGGGVLPAGEASPLSADVEGRLAQYRKLRELLPDVGVFSDPLFRSLQRPTSIAPGPGGGAGPAVGRQNPFAPFQ